MNLDSIDAVIRSLKAIDSSRNKQQATLLLNYHCRKLIAQTISSRMQNARTRKAIRDACDELVSRSFFAIARTGDVLERWTAHRADLATDSDLRPREGHSVKQPGQGRQNGGKVKLHP
jgi:hypothetical protein